jgi:cysteine desulfurase
MQSEPKTLPIYMDYSATTPVDTRVVEKMVPYLHQQFGNPASRSHAFGWESEEAVERAREEVAKLVNADPREIVWTSGATEGNNLAIKGAAHFYSGKGRHIITVRTEHKAVLDTCRELERQGFEVTYLDVREDGLVDLDVLKQSLRPDTILVSVMMVNNEIGVVQPVAQIGEICRAAGIVFHCDAVQAAGKIPVDLSVLKIDLLTVTAHKVYGPKGIGALYVRRKPRIRLEAQIHGGGHERGMRSGTLPVPLIVGIGKACEIARTGMPEETARTFTLRERLREGIMSKLPESYLNGHPTERLPGNANISFAYVEGEGLMMGIKDVSVSSGSACTSASLEPSYVLRALGVGDELAHSSIRFGIGRFNTEAEVDAVVDLVVREVNRLREMSPLYEMVQAGIDIKKIEWAHH